jgi:Reverse transcriptase (RNA-dependent DNA polymerase)
MHLAVEMDPLNYFALSTAAGNPTTIQEGLSMPGEEGEAWERTRQAEWQNMPDHNIFGPLAEPPPGTKVLKTGTTVKMNRREGKLTKRKVCIIAKGFSQIPGLHYNNTYAPVMQWESFRLLLALGVISKKKIRQFDVKLVYLHGLIKEEVWVDQPEGFKVPGKMAHDASSHIFANMAVS